MTRTIGDDPITLFGEGITPRGVEIDPTLSLDETYDRLCRTHTPAVVAVNRFSDSILKILDTTAEPRRYFTLEYGVPAVGKPGQPHTQRLVKIVEWRQIELWVMP